MGTDEGEVSEVDDGFELGFRRGGGGWGGEFEFVVASAAATATTAAKGSGDGDAGEAWWRLGMGREGASVGRRRKHQHWLSHLCPDFSD